MLAVGTDVPEIILQRLASEWATQRGAQLLRLDGDINIVAQTRARVNQLVSDSIRDGDSLQTLQKTLRDDFQFSKTRAERVSRTETANALGQGSKAAALEEGRNEKRWITQGDEEVTSLCLLNESQGWIKLGDPFDSGDDTIPQHPNCRCNVRYRVAPLQEERSPQEVLGPRWREFRVPEGYCEKCGKRDTVVSNRDGDGFWCRRCNVAIP